MAIITTGDHTNIPVTLKKNGKTFTISSGAVIKAVITNTARNAVISPEVIIDNNATGTDLANSLIVVEFNETESSAITQLNDAMLEIQVADPEKKTWTTPILIRQGNIA